MQRKLLHTQYWAPTRQKISIQKVSLAFSTLKNTESEKVGRREALANRPAEKEDPTIRRRGTVNKSGVDKIFTNRSTEKGDRAPECSGQKVRRDTETCKRMQRRGNGWERATGAQLWRFAYKRCQQVRLQGHEQSLVTPSGTEERTGDTRGTETREEKDDPKVLAMLRSRIEPCGKQLSCIRTDDQHLTSHAWGLF